MWETLNLIQMRKGCFCWGTWVMFYQISDIEKGCDVFWIVEWVRVNLLKNMILLKFYYSLSIGSNTINISRRFEIPIFALGQKAQFLRKK